MSQGSQHKQSLKPLLQHESTKSPSSLETPVIDLFDANWIYLIDSGGQPQFVDVLPLLFHTESLHIVVIRLDEELDSKPKVRFYNKGEDVYIRPDNLTLTNREFIELACQMAEAQATSGNFVPKVMVVGTHKDKLGIYGEARLKRINEELMKIHQEYSNVLIRKSTDEVIYAVNAMAPDGKERQRYTKELQECILKAAEKNGDVVDVPFNWLVFHLGIDKTGGIVQKSECYKTGEILGMERSEIEDALRYFDKVALLFYYPDDVPDLVFTNMDSLIGRLSNLITASFITPKGCITAPYDRLRQKGLFKKFFLSIIFEDLYNSGEKLSDDNFLKILEYLKIAVNVGDDEYFLPSALSLESTSCDFPFQTRSAPLIFTWDEQILPHGFFLTLVVMLLRQTESNDSLHFELRKYVIQCRHEIQLVVAKRRISGVVKLANRKRWVEICYSGDMSYCFQLREVITKAVLKVLEVFEHSGLGSPTMGFLCSLCNGDDHYCVLSNDQRRVSCSRIETIDGSVTPDMSCWIKRWGQWEMLY